MAVTAKFNVSRKSPLGEYTKPDGEEVPAWAHEVEFTPDYAQGRNAEWAAATPAGMIRLTIKNELASEQFNPGDHYTIIFERNEE